MPTFFITLSCAEHHWKDIEKLVCEKYKLAGLPKPNFTKNKVKLMNDNSLVVQECFAKRVELWLETIGKNVFKIKHHWVRFEFAPTRGQTHAHLLAITDHLEMQRKCASLSGQKSQLEKCLGEWMKDNFAMTAAVGKSFGCTGHQQSVHPCALRCSEASDTHEKVSFWCDCHFVTKSTKALC